MDVAGTGTRTVPAWSQDVARVAAGETPPVRTFRIGHEPPYWESGDAFLPYGENYFSTAAESAPATVALGG